jgi:thymidine kinase
MGLKGGSVTVICGPMFSGKTERLLEHASRWRMIPQVTTCLVKHCRDTRSTFNAVTTHAGVSRQADLIAEDMDQVLEYVEIRKVNVVAIDEGKTTTPASNKQYDLICAHV